MLHLGYRNTLPDEAHTGNVIADLNGGCAAMPDPEALPLDLTEVLVRFPERAALVLRLAGEDDVFRGICEDFALACITLVRLTALADTDRNPAVVADYELLIADLETDIAEAFRRADARE